jgi:hypothetical protein
MQEAPKGWGKKKIGALALCIIIVIVVIVTMFNSSNMDVDGDLLLDGASVYTTVDSEVYTNLMNTGIIHYEDKNGSVVFIGEEDVGGRQFRLDSGLAFRVQEHMDYLNSLSAIDQYVALQRGELWDRDPDHDDMDTAFEVYVVGLDPYVTNDRYFVFFDTLNNNITSVEQHVVPFEPCGISPPLPTPNDGWNSLRRKYYRMRYMLQQYNYNPDNIIHYWNDTGTFENFQTMIADLTQIVDTNDIVYIHLEGHGNYDEIAFNDGNGGDGAMNTAGGTIVPYEEIDRLFDEIHAS